MKINESSSLQILRIKKNQLINHYEENPRSYKNTLLDKEEYIALLQENFDLLKSRHDAALMTDRYADLGKVIEEINEFINQIEDELKCARKIS